MTKHYTLSDVIAFSREQGIQGTTEEKIKAYLDHKYPKEEEGDNKKVRRNNITLIVWSNSRYHISQGNTMNRADLLLKAFNVAEPWTKGKGKIEIEQVHCMYGESELLTDALNTPTKPRGRTAKGNSPEDSDSED